MAGFYGEIHVSTMTGTLRNITYFETLHGLNIIPLCILQSLIKEISSGNKDLIKYKLSASEAAVW